MKYEWRKQKKTEYGAKTSPSLVNILPTNYILIDGKGNPNEADFSNRVSVLYAWAYAIKKAYKEAPLSDAFDDFTVFPLEGVWSNGMEDGKLVKDHLAYTIMIAQPDFVDEKLAQAALARVKEKKPDPLWENVQFGTMADGPCVQVLHVGSYDDEPASFAKMDAFTRENHLERTQAAHREIYLSNANRVEPAKRKTILRYAVK
ncbi:GyrI-like domain-containing protein [uncultured Dubosiella sp.]|uniref:GyrI-like domain-containing protein n=1 Tax=uncultured Dubosiella sp. TaxID=1937011 RepID=UPI0025B59A47|nr:GyrI-like domain-containing protein [uncultured Dubosiella sp.]